jgi:Cu-Zn family superoxide dismutase
MPKVNKAGGILLALLVPVFLLSAADKKKPKKDKHKKADQVKKAICLVHPLGDSKVYGTVSFAVKGKSVEVTGTIKGLTPGKHGFHVHEYGDCSSKDGMSAGSHFDPEHMPHGGPHSEKRHIGDLGNIEADENGVAEIKITDSKIKLNGPHSIIGRSIIVHAKEDDLKDIKSAGARIGCGVIGIAKP